MKIGIVIASLAVLTLSCKEEMTIDKPQQSELRCEEIECSIVADFYGVGIMQNDCWTADASYIDLLSSSSLSITLGKNEINGIGENLRFVINDVTDLADTIWLGWTDVTIPAPNIAEARYFYTEGHSSAGKFDFEPYSELTSKDFLIIDYINEDTSIVEGRFQVYFTRKIMSSFVPNAPEEMNIRCGRFKSKEL